MSFILVYKKNLKQQRKDYLEADEAQMIMNRRKIIQRKQAALNRDMVKCKYLKTVKIILQILRYE